MSLHLSFLCRGESLAAGCPAAFVEFLDPAGQSLGFLSNQGVPAGEKWTRGWLHFRAPDGAATCRVQLTLLQATGACRFADPRLQVWHGLDLSELSEVSLDEIFDAAGLWRPNMYSHGFYDPSKALCRGEVRMIAPSWDAVRDGHLRLPLRLRNTSSVARTVAVSLCLTQVGAAEHRRSPERRVMLAADESVKVETACAIPAWDFCEAALRGEVDGREIFCATDRYFLARRDAIMPARHAFPPVPVERIIQKLVAEHELWETQRRRDGSWGERERPGAACTRPLQREVVWRVIEYLSILRLVPVPFLEARVAAGLDWLVADQDPSGAFRWWRTPEGTIDINSLYDGGCAGRALVEGYAYLGDARYERASRRELEWEMRTRLAGNTNYNSFSIWHAAGRYQFLRDADALEHALWRNRESVFRDQTADGSWARHNGWTCYVSIIVRGLTALYAALPEGHVLKADVRQRTIAAVNALIGRQLPDGQLAASFTDKTTHPGWYLGTFGMAARDLQVDLGPAIHGALTQTPDDGGFGPYLEYLAQAFPERKDEIVQRLRTAFSTGGG